MALQHLRSSTANKRPLPAGMSDGQLAINTNAASPGLFFKDSSGNLVKTGPVHVGTTAPNASPASGGATGNSTGELWLDTSVSPNQLKTWNGSAWVSDFPDEIPVAKLADGAARQLLQTDAAGTGVEWTSNVDVPGTLDVTSTATFDSIASHPLGSAGAPTITFTGDTNTGIYSPGADQLALSTNNQGRLFIDSSGNIGVGTASPSSYSYSDLVVSGSTGGMSIVTGTSDVGRLVFADGVAGVGAFRGAIEYDHANDALRFASNGGEKARIDSSGRLGIGTSSPTNVKLEIKEPVSNTAGTGHLGFSGASTPLWAWRLSDPTADLHLDRYSGGWAATPPLTVTRSTGNVGIGTTPSTLLHIASSTPVLRLEDTDTNGYGQITVDNGGSVYIQADAGNTQANSSIRFYVDALNEAARIDSDRRLLVGTSSTSVANAAIFQGNSAGTDVGVVTIASKAASPANGALLGVLDFAASNHVRAARIEVTRDGGTWTSGVSQPSRLVFSTTADGASSPTRRMSIKQDGSLVFGDFDAATSTASGGKAYIDSSSTLYVAVGGGTVAYFNRNTDDGEVVAIRQGNVTEGSISVSGTTVTYGGGHLARWSQLPNNEDPSTLLKGTVMSNLDDMCQWEGEDNEQLNRTKVSDVEGDPNVAGVFVSTSFSEDGPLDFFVGMTGDMVIRIAQGVTVDRGDLLMSAGDGTAKPQDDDIIRSKTIAKVTSTNVSCTYNDGSYCVPCVLMAC